MGLAILAIMVIALGDGQSPPSVREAIAEKLQREQQVAAEAFQNEIIQERARQQVEEKIIESDQFKKVFEENEELKPYEEQTKKLIKGLFD